MSETEEGERWNHAELVEYLKKEGVKVKAEPTNEGIFHGPVVYLNDGGGRVYCQKRANRQAAHDQAGNATGAFSWGAFLFVPEKGGSTLADKIAKVLQAQ